VYAFARPTTGDTFTAVLSRVTVERMAEALAAFAAHADPDSKKVLVLVLDNAGWHGANA
jgi:predicted enzyme involved in methoxymalonyl-ACP biosynthesis